MLKYFKKTIDIFEYVNKIQLYQFIENWKPMGGNMEKLSKISIENIEYDEFEKQVCTKSMSIILIIDGKYLIQMRQTCESKKNRQLYFEIKYLCPTYSSKIENPSKKEDPFDVNGDSNFYEGDCL